MTKAIRMVFIIAAGLAAFGVLLDYSSGQNTVNTNPPPPREIMEAIFTATPVAIDGVLDDAVWAKAASYPLRIKREDEKAGKVLQEGGTAKLAWDKEYFYVGVEFTDTDIVAEGNEDQLHHYNMGDVLEVFLKPVDNTWYWELYATPKGKKTNFFLPGRGRLWLDSNTNYICGLKVAAKCNGTLNQWEDKDKSWTAEMAMPIKDLTARGEKFTPDAKWIILVARYNYSRYLTAKEFSTAPQLVNPLYGYHSHETYGELRLKQ